DLGYNVGQNLIMKLGVCRKKLNGINEIKKVYTSLNESISEIESFLVDNGTIRAKGLELSVASNYSKISSQLTYTITSSETHFPSINNGYSYPTNFARLHNFTLANNLNFSSKLTANLNMVYQSGQPVTFPTNAYINEFNTLSLV